jgi:hypothetical protein
LFLAVRPYPNAIPLQEPFLYGPLAFYSVIVVWSVIYAVDAWRLAKRLNGAPSMETA